MTALMAGCGSEPAVNPPTEPADPVLGPGADAFGPAGQGAVYRPGTGPASFMGRWSEDVALCSRDPGGQGTPVEITTDGLNGGGASCAIETIQQIGDSYDLQLRCPSVQRVRLSVTDNVLTALYLAPEVRRVTLNKCTTLTDTNPDEGAALAGVLNAD